MLDPEVGTEAVELVVARGRALAQAEQPVGELLAVVGENTCDLHRRGALQVTQEAARVGGRLRWVDADEDPSGRTVNRHEEVASPLLVRHLRQVFHVDMQIAGLIGPERLVRRLRRLWCEVAELAHPMSPQTAIQPGARDVRVQELANDGQQVVERQQQSLPQRYGNRLLGRGQRRLQPVRGVAVVVNAIPLAPLPDRLFGDAVALRNHPRRLIARLHRSSDPGCRRRLLVKRDQHDRPPSRTSRRNDLAMKSADRRESM
ncbi:hypothetical protein PARU111607_18005 [Palleronia rufa]